MKRQPGKLSLLCPSPTVPHLFPNEDEQTIQVYPGCHSWSFQSIPIHSNTVLLIRLGLAGKYESFEHVQKLCVASTNEFHSCLTNCQCVAIVFIAQLTYCILVIRTIFLLYSGCSYCIPGHSYLQVRLGHHANGPEDSSNEDGMCRKVDIRVDYYILGILFSYSIRFILVRLCEILGRTEQCSYYFCTFKNDFVHLTFKTKKNECEFLTFYIRPRSAVDSAQWDRGIKTNII